MSTADTRAAVAAVPLWYHAIEVAPGVVTPGWFDLRPIVNRMPWPDLRGKRCLDLGTYDGFLAFEMERRGAAEVVAADLSDHEQWDWPVRIRARGLDYLRSVAGSQKGEGLRVACQVLDSSVQIVECSAYDLDPADLGMFDVVVCGSLLLHLREPLRALETIRSVCGGHFLCTNEVDLRLTTLARGPAARLDGMTDLCQWWVPNPAGHRQMVAAMGFAIERESGVYAIPFGPAHPPVGRDARSRAGSLARRALGGTDGVLHHAVLARPDAATG